MSRRAASAGAPPAAAKSSGAPTAPPPAETSTSPAPSAGSALPPAARHSRCSGSGRRSASARGERRIERDERRVAVDEHGVEEARAASPTISASRPGFFDATSISRTEQATSGRGLRRAWTASSSGSSSKRELPAAEGKELDQHDIGIDVAIEVEERVAPRAPATPRRPGLPVCVEQRGKILARDRGRRQLRRRFTPLNGDFRQAAGRRSATVTSRPCRRHRLGQDFGALQMPDAEQVLDVEEHARAHARGSERNVELARPTACRPRDTRRRCARPSRSLCGGLSGHRPAGRQRVERAQHALVRDQDRRRVEASRAAGAAAPARRAGSRRRAGGNRARAPRSRAIAAPSSARSSARRPALPFAPVHLDQARLGPRVEAEQRRRLHRAAERARQAARARAIPSGRRMPRNRSRARRARAAGRCGPGSARPRSSRSGRGG